LLNKQKPQAEVIIAEEQAGFEGVLGLKGTYGQHDYMIGDDEVVRFVVYGRIFL